jgi:uncharacterized protein involved in type VI secretion and phage assembly
MKPAPFATAPHWLMGAHIAIVTSVQDPDRKSRIQVQIIGADADGDALLWARVAVPFAGDNRGAFLIPDVGDEVIVHFIGGDPRFPVVCGALWNGQTAVPETIAGDRIDRWTLTGRNGTRIAIIEENQGQEKVEIETPTGQKATLTDASGGKIELATAGGSRLTMDSAGVKITTSGKFEVQASSIKMTAGQVNVDTALAKFSLAVKCEMLTTTSVVSKSYTPGAGNIW